MAERAASDEMIEAMDASLADIRRFLIDYFSDEELTALCFDHFDEVYRNLPSEATTNRKSLMLLDYCRRRGRLPELLAVLRRDRPEPYQRVFGRRTSAAGGRTDLNTAGIEELIALPGIGPALAKAIVENRPFQSMDDLLRIRQIGPRRLAALRDWCDV